MSSNEEIQIWTETLLRVYVPPMYCEITRQLLKARDGHEPSEARIKQFTDAIRSAMQSEIEEFPKVQE